MPRIGPKDPAGYVYVVAAERGPKSAPYHTKIGCSSRSFEDQNGRGFIARFWIEALGLGELRVEEIQHPNAYGLEKLVHAELTPTPGCGRSREVFDIKFEDAVALVKRRAQDVL